jgi:hypothetical protein
MKTLFAVVALALVQSPGRLVAQSDSASTQSQLVARGMGADVAASIGAVVRQTNERGLPGRAIAEKAVEGAFKRVPPQRIVAAVRDLAQRLERARTDLRGSGVSSPAGIVIAGSAEASAQGIGTRHQVQLIRAARSDSAASAGLSVAAALVVQGLDGATAASLVAAAYERGQSVAQVLDLPAAARALQVRGATSTEVGRQLMDGISSSVTIGGRAGAAVRPVVPPVRVP